MQCTLTFRLSTCSTDVDRIILNKNATTVIKLVLNGNKITEVAMVGRTPIRIAWELHQAGQPIVYIASRVDVHRSTVYRWLKEIRKRDLGRNLIP